MRHCLYCEEPLGEGAPVAPASGRRHAYDPVLGRLWEICSRCGRWNPVPMELRWETLEGWERAVRDEGDALLRTEHLALVRVGEGEVVRVDRPPRIELGGWRYGNRLPLHGGRPGFFRRLLGALPTPPLGGYDPYGLDGMGGIGGESLPRRWLASPFFEAATPLTVAFASIPFAPECPSCSLPMGLHPWEFQNVSFRTSGGEVGLEATCAHCGEAVLLRREAARPALRLGLGILDSGEEARRTGEAAAAALDQVGGGPRFLRGLGQVGAPIGELDRRARLALGIALDEEAEAEALEAEWREAEEIAAIMDGELTRVEGFLAFRARVLRELTGEGE